VLLSLLFGVTLGWLPTGGWVPWSTNPVGSVTALILPCLALGIIEAAGLSRYVRSAVMDVLAEDYVRSARASGMSRTGALLRIGLPNAGLPLLNVLGVQVASLIGGAVIVEQVFSLPGLSTMIVSAVTAREVIVVQSVVMVLVTFVMVVNLVVDLLVGVLDPRVRSAR
jgi:peptide/nickel transport system permease protein